ncbi:hypothetical protein [Nocardia sp. CA-119907]|uniref:hypothetical protein n=1 Tax=Nocardia sp. CA-119907 TaxID=3239973 RepID=UPI003D98E937
MRSAACSDLRSRRHCSQAGVVDAAGAAAVGSHLDACATPELSRARVYMAVIDFRTTDDRVDTNRIGILVVSSGVYWSTRIAPIEPKLRASIANGAPADRSAARGPAESPKWKQLR